MKCEAEEPVRHFLTRPPPIFKPDKLGEGVCNYSMLITGRRIVLPSDPLHSLSRPHVEGYFTIVIWEFHAPCEGWIEHSVDYAQRVGKWEAVEIGLVMEGPGILLADAFEGPRYQICDHGVGSGVEKHAKATQDRYCCKLLRALGDHCTAICGFDTTNEDIKTAYNQWGIDSRQCYCREVVQS